MKNVASAVSAALLCLTLPVHAADTPNSAPAAKAAAAPAPADKDMNDVLSALAAMHPKAIEKLSAAEARKQPSSFRPRHFHAPPDWCDAPLQC